MTAWMPTRLIGRYALGSSGYSDILTLDNTVFWQKNKEAF